MRITLLTTLLAIFASYTFGQTEKGKLNGTWVYVKIMMDGKEMESANMGTHVDTIFINNKYFEQTTWVKEEKSLGQFSELHFEFKQSGELVLEKNKMTIKNRATSMQDTASPPDVYYKYKLKRGILLVSNPSVVNDKIEGPSVWWHYRKLKN